MSNKTLLVVAHGVKLNGDAYKRLEEAGFVVVRGDPSDFHVIEPLPLMDQSALYAKALRIIRAHHCDAPRVAIANHVIDSIVGPVEKKAPLQSPLTNTVA